MTARLADDTTRATRVAVEPEPVDRAARLARLKAEFRQKVDAKLAARDRRMVPPPRAPRYDETYHRGVAWLDAMADGDDQ